MENYQETLNKLKTHLLFKKITSLEDGYLILSDGTKNRF